MFYKDTKIIFYFQIFLTFFLICLTEYLSSPIGLKSIIQIYETFFIYPNDFSFIFVEMQGFEPWSKELTNMFHSQAYPIFLNWQFVSPLLFIESASRTLY